MKLKYKDKSKRTLFFDLFELSQKFYSNFMDYQSEDENLISLLAIEKNF